MPIIVAPVGEKLKVIKILADDNVARHLASLGITIDCDVEVTSKTAGSVVLLVKGSRLALDSGVATKILVARG